MGHQAAEDRFLLLPDPVRGLCGADPLPSHLQAARLPGHSHDLGAAAHQYGWTGRVLERETCVGGGS